MTCSTAAAVMQSAECVCVCVCVCVCCSSQYSAFRNCQNKSLTLFDRISFLCSICILILKIVCFVNGVW